MIEMELSKIRIDERREEQVIVLKEKAGGRALPIIISIFEASAIKLEVTGLKPPRPLTHDLLFRTIEHMGGKVERVVVTELKENTFYARIIIKKEGERRVEIDARPSDSIALAVRAKVPIYVNEDVLKQAASQFNYGKSID
jgi:bifunctional DNase/RNase